MSSLKRLIGWLEMKWGLIVIMVVSAIISWEYGAVYFYEIPKYNEYKKLPSAWVYRFPRHMDPYSPNLILEAPYIENLSQKDCYLKMVEYIRRQDSTCVKAERDSCNREVYSAMVNSKCTNFLSGMHRSYGFLVGESRILILEKRPDSLVHFVHYGDTINFLHHRFGYIHQSFIHMKKAPWHWQQRTIEHLDSAEKWKKYKRDKINFL